MTHEQLCSMLVFDTLIYNEDRHFGNFGVLRDNLTGNIVAAAPSSITVCRYLISQCLTISEI